MSMCKGTEDDEAQTMMTTKDDDELKLAASHHFCSSPDKSPKILVSSLGHEVLDQRPLPSPLSSSPAPLPSGGIPHARSSPCTALA